MNNVFPQLFYGSLNKTIQRIAGRPRLTTMKGIRRVPGGDVRGDVVKLLSKCGLGSDQTPAEIVLPENFASQIFKNNVYYNRKKGMGTHFTLKE